jgi:hypothetical protein
MERLLIKQIGALSLGNYVFQRIGSCGRKWANHWPLSMNQFHNIPKCSVTTLTVFFTAMNIGTISMRINWPLQTDGALYAPVKLNHLDSSLGMTCDQIHLRVERQTLRKLPQTGNVLFTIRTNLAPVSAWQGNEGAIENLLFVLGDMSPEMRHCKGAAIYEASLGHMLRNK